MSTDGDGGLDAPALPLINELVRREIRGMFGEQYRLLGALMHGPQELTFLEAMDHSRTKELQFKHALRVAAIMERSGWPGPIEVGFEAAGCLSMVLDHARQFPEIQQRILPIMERAFYRGEVEPGLYATYVDDVMLRAGAGQIYGTSIVQRPDGLYALELPVADIAHLDQRRAEILLPPIAEQLAEYNSAEHLAHVALANQRSPWKKRRAAGHGSRKGSGSKS